LVTAPRFLRGDVKAVQPIEPDEAVVGTDQNVLPFAVIFRLREWHSGLGKDDPGAEGSEIGALQYRSLSALHIDLQEVDLARSVQATYLRQRTHLDLHAPHIPAARAMAKRDG
jgi:hypothetical protein